MWKCLTGIENEIYIIIRDYSNMYVCINIYIYVCVSADICMCVCDNNNMQIIIEETIVVDGCRYCNLHSLSNTLTHF